MIWLIAEDEADIRNLIALMCQVWGHTPLTFENGQKVWEWLDALEQGQHSQVPDLILMDIRMPGKKGNELAHRMRTLESLRQTPITLMTAFSLSEQERSEMIMGDGVDHILSKPLPDFEQLRGVLDNIIQKKKDNLTPPKTPAPSDPLAEQKVSPQETAQPELTEQQATPAEVTESLTKVQETTLPVTLETQTREADQT